MKALIFSQAGAPRDVLEFADHPEPVVGPGEALVEVQSRPIQPADLAFVMGRYRIQPKFPQVAGLEGAGRIVTAPQGSGFYPGQRVAFRYPGAWAERVAVPIERLMPVPDAVHDDVAAQMALNPLTAWGLLDTVKVRPDEVVLLTAGTSTVSQIIAGICRHRGIRTVAVVRGDAFAARARTCADAVVSSDAPTMIDEIRHAAAGRPISGLLDSVGGRVINHLMPVLSPGATIAAYGVMDPSGATVPNAALIYANLTWIGFGIDRWLEGLGRDQRAGTIAELWNYLLQRDFSLPVAARHPLSDFVAALDDNAAPARAGKVLLTC